MPSEEPDWPPPSDEAALSEETPLCSRSPPSAVVKAAACALQAREAAALVEERQHALAAAVRAQHKADSALALNQARTEGGAAARPLVQCCVAVSWSIVARALSRPATHGGRPLAPRRLCVLQAGVDLCGRAQLEAKRKRRELLGDAGQ